MKKLFRLIGREPAVERDVRDELSSHLAMKVDDLVRGGMDPTAALTEAKRQFGALEPIERATRAQADGAQRRSRWSNWSNGWVTDCRIALRGLRRAPLFTISAGGILALGIGASVAVLGIADRILFRPLPFADAGRLMVLMETRQDGALRLPSYPTVKDWQAESTVFESIAYVPGTQVSWRLPAGVENVAAAFPSPEFFPLMGTPPLLGRTLTKADDIEEARVAVLSHAVWRRRFGGDPAAIGATISLSDGPVTVVGVMPAGFRFPEWADLYLPMRALPSETQTAIAFRGNHADAYVVGRLQVSLSRPKAEAALKVLANQLAKAYPDEQASWTDIMSMPIGDFILQYGSRGLSNPIATIMVFTAAVGLVLLIACANVAGLTLVRGQGRGRELAIRTAIGASRWHLVRQLLIESVVLAGGGGLLGIALGGLLLDLLKQSAPELLPRLVEVRLDPRLILVTVGLALLSAVLSGLGPALKATPDSLASLVKGGGFQGTSSVRTTRVQRVLVVGQIGLAVTLLIGAAVLIKSFVRVMDADLGFDPHGLIGVAINPAGGNRTKEGAVELYRHLLEAVAGVPGVGQVALTNHLPIGGASLPTRLVIDGYTPATKDDQLYANFRVISPEYFDTMGIPVKRGRVFTAADLGSPNDGLVVNQSLAKRYWPDQDPIGKRITVFKSARWLADFGEPISGLVIGVVGDVRHFGPESTPPDEVYLPYTWNPWAWTGLVIRTAANPAQLIDPIWKAINGVDPDLPVNSGASRNIATFEDRLVESRRPRRLMTVSAAATALVAVVLALAGLYGVMAYLVGLRRREIAIRSALGATRRQVLALVMRQGLAIGLLGTGLGLAAGWAAASILQRLVFGVSVRDVTAFTVVPLLLLGMVAAAVYFPARRASSLDPAGVLKED